jgi:crotonobetainyl-CoA:carnitine CoA-transferase CaiB-like acyl-CoA transferase
MKLLTGHRVVALDESADGALARFLVSLGATATRISLSNAANALATADFFIEQRGAEALASAGLAPMQLNPALIHVSVTPFGSSGPRANWQGSELVISAMGGTLRLTGDVDRAPVKEALDACWFHADMVAAAGALAALYDRHASGRGQHVDVSAQEVAFLRNVNGILAWQFDRRQLQRVGGALNYGRAIVRCIWPLADGYCFHTLMTGRFGAPANQGLSDWMDEVGVPNPLRSTDWVSYNRSTLEPAKRAEWETAIEAFFGTRTRAQINSEGRRRGINATVLASPTDVLADPHLQARGFWDESDSEDTRCLLPNPRPLSQGREPKTHVCASSPPPVAGGGLERGRIATRFVTVTSASSKCVSNPKHTHASCARKGPLAGVRVLDFSWALVGSITTKVLGDLGAEIVKVESRTRPCLSRIDVQVSASRADSFDDKPWFAHLNTSKQSLALDMKQPASREILNPLIEWADVVVENFSPGTMHKLGLDYARLAERNPNIVMVSGSVFGQTGPLAQEWGVDGTGAALSGRTLLTGWPDRAPVIPSAVPYGDVIVPYVMAAAVAAALNHRRASGVGCHIDASMYEICVQQMAAAIAAARDTIPTREGNRDTRVFHQGVYRTADDANKGDRWVAITLQSAAEWHALRTHAKLPDAANVDERDAQLTAWTQSQDCNAVAAQLQALGIAAGMVQDIENLMEHDPQIAARGALVQLNHPLLGAFGHARTPITFSHSAIEPYRAPSLGEHSRQVAATLCGLTSERIIELESVGIFK